MRDKILSLVDEFAAALKLPHFKAAYEGLVDRGVDFPVRSETDADAKLYNSTAGDDYQPPSFTDTGWRFELLIVLRMMV